MSQGEELPTDVPTLQQQLRLARAQNAYLNRELARALRQPVMPPKDATPGMLAALAVKDLKHAFALLKLHYDEAQRQVAQLTRQLAYAEKVLGWKPAPDSLLDTESMALDVVLRQLLTLAHPDRWAQGQAASELAHEITVALNAQRTTFSPQPRKERAR
jgi:hypothetical protein